jgi:hypothetical protein
LRDSFHQALLLGTAQVRNVHQNINQFWDRFHISRWSCLRPYQ